MTQTKVQRQAERLDRIHTRKALRRTLALVDHLSTDTRSKREARLLQAAGWTIVSTHQVAKYSQTYYLTRPRPDRG